jgi:hypothetical protein
VTGLDSIARAARLVSDLAETANLAAEKGEDAWRGDDNPLLHATADAAHAAMTAAWDLVDLIGKGAGS